MSRVEAEKKWWPCFRCKGTGKFHHLIGQPRFKEDLHIKMEGPCPQCKGTGKLEV